MADKKTTPYADVRLEAIREEIEAAVVRKLEAGLGAGTACTRFRERRKKRKESEALFRR